MSSLGAGMAPTLPPAPRAPLSARHTVGAQMPEGTESCFSSLCCSPRDPAPAPERPPLQADSPVFFHPISDEVEPEHQPCPCLCAEPGGGGVAAPPPGHTSQWRLGRREEGGGEEVPPELALLSQGPKVLRHESEASSPAPLLLAV